MVRKSQGKRDMSDQVFESELITWYYNELRSNSKTLASSKEDEKQIKRLIASWSAASQGILYFEEDMESATRPY